MNRYGTNTEQLLRHFHAWEIRGRGWTMYPTPVELEPPFRPFEQHFIWQDDEAVDTGRRPGLLSSLLGTSRVGTREPAPSLEDLTALYEEPEAYPVSTHRSVCELHVLLPSGYEPSRALSEQLLESLHLCTHPIAFELIGTADGVSLQFACDPDDERDVRQQLAALLPEASIRRRDFFLAIAWTEAPDRLVVEFGLEREFMRPIRPLGTFGVDPLAAVVAAMTELRENETAVLQVIFEPARAPWADSMNRASLDNSGAPLRFLPADLPSLAKQKTQRPLYAAVVRVAASSDHSARTLSIVNQLTATLSQFNDPTSNELIPLSNDEYEDEEAHATAFRSRVSHRPGMILSLDELTGLVHLPWATVRHPSFQRASRRTRAAPKIAMAGSLVLGTNEHNGEVVPVSVSAEQRMRHTYIIGASGSGKSVMLLNMILHDVESGNGLAVMDPHGDLVDAVLERIPAGRAGDVVVVDPADEEYPVGLNILAAHSELERTLLSSDLVGVFRRFSTSWGDQMTTVLGNALLAFLESPDGGTLLDLRRFLGDPKARASYLRAVADPEVRYYWDKEFPLLRGNPQASILTRLDTFLRPKLIRRMFAQKRSLDFRRLMDERRIVLVKLSQGAIGEENAYLLGALTVAKLNQAALSRQELDASARADFYLYMDEFHNLVTPSIAALLSGVRKYRLGLTLAHQDLTQLTVRDSEVAASVLSNAYTRIVFRVGDTDARKLADGFSSFEVSDLQNLGIGQAIARVERAEYDFNLETVPPPAPVSPTDAEQARGRVLDASRKAHATPRAEVDALLAAFHQPVEEPPAPAPNAPEAQQPAPRPQPSESAPAGAQPEPIRRERAPQRAPATPGRGGKAHKYIQSLIKQFGEAAGYRATIERQFEDGHVDVALENGTLRIACEVSVTTESNYEAANARKRLASGFNYVTLIATEKKQQDRLRRAIERDLSPSEIERIRVLAPEDVPAFLTAIDAAAAGREERVGGYKVKTSFKPLDGAERGAREKAVGQTIRDALKRLRRTDE